MARVLATVHSVDLHDGREVAVGEIIDADVGEPHNAALIEAGLLVVAGGPAEQEPAPEAVEAAAAPDDSSDSGETPPRARRTGR